MKKKLIVIILSIQSLAIFGVGNQPKREWSPFGTGPTAQKLLIKYQQEVNQFFNTLDYCCIFLDKEMTSVNDTQDFTKIQNFLYLEKSLLVAQEKLDDLGSKKDVLDMSRSYRLLVKKYNEYYKLMTREKIVSKKRSKMAETLSKESRNREQGNFSWSKQHFGTGPRY